MDDDLLALLECPIARVPLVRCGSWLYAKNRDGRHKYEIRGGLPDLRAEHAQVAGLEEFDRVMSAVPEQDERSLDETK